MSVGAVISCPTTHGSFVSPGYNSTANLSTLLPLGPALIHTTVCFDIFSDILFWEVLHYFYPNGRICPRLFFKCSFN